MKLFSSSIADCCKQKRYDSDIAPESPNPDPSKYKIIKNLEIGGNTLLMAQYEGCTNYEGKKILLYKASYEELLQQDVLDPHFSKSKLFHHPFARFRPTNDGWREGKAVLYSLKKKKYGSRGFKNRNQV